MEVLNVKLHFSDNIKTLWINFHFIKDYTQRIKAHIGKLSATLCAPIFVVNVAWIFAGIV